MSGRRPNVPSLKLLNPAYSLRKARLRDLRVAKVHGWEGGPWMLVRGKIPDDIGWHTGALDGREGIRRAVAIIENVGRLAPTSPRATFGAPIRNSGIADTERDIKGYWILPTNPMRTDPHNHMLYADADLVELATRIMWGRGVSPEATWRYVHVADVLALQFLAERCSHVFALADVDGRTGAIVAPTRKGSS